MNLSATSKSQIELGYWGYGWIARTNLRVYKGKSESGFSPVTAKRYSTAHVKSLMEEKRTIVAGLLIVWLFWFLFFMDLGI